MKNCFFICPLGTPKSKIRNCADAVLNQIVRPVVAALGYNVERADLATEHQWSIPESISQHIFEDDLVIADLTKCNPNVFYELGKRHAWGGRCIHLTQNIKTLPFDISHYRVIEYNLLDPASLDEVRKNLRLGIRSIEKVPYQCPFPLTPEKLIELSGATVLLGRVDGRRDHYYLAEQIAKSDCRRIFLMQRSSSLILGPEQGWGAEKNFYYSVLQKIEDGAEFFHVVSLVGIARHLARPQSIFPETVMALKRLSKDDECVGINGPKNIWYFKRISDEEDDRDLKPDRQARTFLVELFNGETQGVVVIDLGGRQSCFHLKGPMIGDFLQVCIKFYHDCPLLTWPELEKIVPN